MASRLLGVLLFIASPLGGCTLIGAGIGAATPSWERVPPQGVSRLRQGTDLEVRAERLEGLPVRDPNTRAMNPAPLATRTVQGEYLGVHNGALLVSSPRGVTVAPFESIRGVRKRSGSYWWVGAGIGLVVDAMAIASMASMFDRNDNRNDYSPKYY